MATKKYIMEIKNSISLINSSIADIREIVIKVLVSDNHMLKERVRKLEIELAEAQQYQRRSNVVISGIPVSVGDDKIESTVINVLNYMDIDVTPRDIEASHRIGKDKKKTIVRFINRKDAEKVLSFRESLKFLDAAQAVSCGLEANTKSLEWASCVVS